MTLADEAVRLLTRWSAPDPSQDALRREYLRFLGEHPDGTGRDGPPAHLTASCFVLSTDGERVLLSHHRKGGFWVQFGGHCEPGDADLPAAALREAREESGLDDLSLAGREGGPPEPVDLDAHELSAAFGRCRRHLDVAFLALADAGAVPRVSAESLDVAWFDVADLPADVAADLPARLARVAAGVRAQVLSPSREAASSPSRNPRARSVRG